MADVFISYSVTDEGLARHVYKYLTVEGVTPFLASLSLKPGTEWEPSLREELKKSSWIVFLASLKACSSPFVQQELGGAWLTGKKILPVVWDMAPEGLPGFLKKYQALDLRNGTLENLKVEMSRIAGDIKADKVIGGLLLAALVGGALWLASKSE